jgi:hypothetical protein
MPVLHVVNTGLLRRVILVHGDMPPPSNSTIKFEQHPLSIYLSPQPLGSKSHDTFRLYRPYIILQTLGVLEC